MRAGVAKMQCDAVHNARAMRFTAAQELFDDRFCSGLSCQQPLRLKIATARFLGSLSATLRGFLQRGHRGLSGFAQLNGVCAGSRFRLRLTRLLSRCSSGLSDRLSRRRIRYRTNHLVGIPFIVHIDLADSLREHLFRWGKSAQIPAGRPVRSQPSISARR